MSKTDDVARRLHPRLRCIRNGAAPANLLRSDIASTVASAPSLSVESIGIPANLDLNTLRDTLPMSPSDAPQRSLPKLAKRPKLAAEPAPEQSFVNVFVEVFRDPSDGEGGEQATLDRIRKIAQSAKSDVAAADRVALGNEVLVRRNFVSATIPISALTQLEQDPGMPSSIPRSHSRSTSWSIIPHSQALPRHEPSATRSCAPRMVTERT